MSSWLQTIQQLPATRRLRKLQRAHRLPEPETETQSSPITDLTTPPAPPIVLNPQVACSPDTDLDVLWHIAQHVPQLRRWIVANPTADASLLEFISQAGGPGVRQALEVLLESLENNSDDE